MYYNVLCHGLAILRKVKSADIPIGGEMMQYGYVVQCTGTSGTWKRICIVVRPIAMMISTRDCSHIVAASNNGPLENGGRQIFNS